jgi:hypothetical protein
MLASARPAWLRQNSAGFRRHHRDERRPRPWRRSMPAPRCCAAASARRLICASRRWSPSGSARSATSLILCRPAPGVLLGAGMDLVVQVAELGCAILLYLNGPGLPLDGLPTRLSPAPGHQCAGTFRRTLKLLVRDALPCQPPSSDEFAGRLLATWACEPIPRIRQVTLDPVRGITCRRVRRLAARDPTCFRLPKNKPYRFGRSR